MPLRAIAVCGSSPAAHTFCRQFCSFFQQPSMLLEPPDTFLAAPPASFLNFHQRSGSPKRIRRRSFVTNRVGMSRDHMYPRGFGPLGKSYCVLCLRSGPEGGVVAAIPAVYLVNILPLRTRDDRQARRFRRTRLFLRSSTLPGEPRGGPGCLRPTLGGDE